jgi:hypothetical protein
VDPLRRGDNSVHFGGTYLALPYGVGMG